MGQQPSVVWVIVLAVCASVRGDVLPFVNEASLRGVSYQMMNYPQLWGIYGFGCAVVDLDSDGDQDIVILGKADGTVGLFENLGAGQFANRSTTSGIAPATAAAPWSGVSAADVDGDRDLDLLLTRLLVGPVLLRQTAPFQFQDITAQSGLIDAGGERASSWADFDGDGNLDMFLANYSNLVAGTSGIPSRLYRGNGDGSFVDVSAQHDIGGHARTFLGCWADYDRDGDPDLYISNDRAMLWPFVANRLLHNGNGQMEDISVGCGAAEPFYSMGIAAADIDENGRIDYFATNISTRDQPLGPINPLFLQTGSGLFTESCAVWGLVPDTLNVTGWATHAFDFDNDRDLDLHVCNQFHTDRFHVNSLMPPMTESAAALGMLGPTQLNRPTHGAAIGDVNGDGGIDVLVNDLGGAVRLMMNRQGPTARWARVRLIGIGGNTQAIGALAEATMGSRTTQHEVLCSGTGYLGQSESVLHIGCGSAGRVDVLRLHWPHGSGERTLANLPTNQHWTIPPTEFLGDFELDRDRDHADRVAFVACLAGGFAPGCEAADFDGDSDIDLLDAVAFDQVFGGLRSDINGDGTVSGKDLAGVLSAWGQPGIADLDHDGLTNGGDLALLLADWTP